MTLYMVVHHLVQDFMKWKIEYDAHETKRQEYSIREFCLLHNIGNRNDLTILCEVSDLAKAMEFLESADLAEDIKYAGVIGKPEISVLKNAKDI
jgi:hypothetical protein